MSVSTAAPLLALLKESDDSVKSYALKSLNEIVDSLWSEISNSITDIEALYDDTKFSDRKIAALIASKVYYNLGEYVSAVKYALAAESAFDIDEKSEYVETIVSQSIQMYIKNATASYLDNQSINDIEPKLTTIFERMMDKCVTSGEYKLALGIALEAFRLDVVENILNTRVQKDSEAAALKLINYVLTAATTTVTNSSFRSNILNSLFKILLAMNSVDYFTVCKIVVNLNDANLAIQLFDQLKADENKDIAYQIAFDLVSSASQGLLTTLMNNLNSKGYDETVIEVLSGVPTCDYYNTFLLNNKNIDIGLLNKSKSSIDGKFSLFHTAVSVANGFMHAGTTDNTFIKDNLPWLDKSKNWAKFTATASLGVINKGNLSNGMKTMRPYLPGSFSTSNSRYIKGGSLYGLGLIYAGAGRDVIDYLKNQIIDNTANSGDEDVDVLLHGASLGMGLAAMSTSDNEIYEILKEVLYNDSAISGEAAALGMGLTMLGAGSESSIHDMYMYAQETKHHNITRGLAMGLALMSYSRQELADELIEKMIKNENALLRYGGAYTIAMAYAGTGNNKAIKKLLHIAVSDSNDDVRRAAVTSLGFVLLRDYTTVPRIVELLSESHNAHVRCGTAFALGIACAGKNVPSAIEVLEPLTKDPVDFVRQAAMIALSMIMIQQTEKLTPKVSEFNKEFLTVIKTKHQEGLAKFGACLAQGIINAGGRNVTIQLENNDMGTLDAKAVVGLAMFSQFWYWFPLAHFLSLSFAPTTVIGVRGSDFTIPKFDLHCHSKEELFAYPNMYEEATDKEVEKVATAVLSTTARAKVRAMKTKKGKESQDSKSTKGEPTQDKSDIKDDQEKDSEKSDKSGDHAETDTVKNKYSSKPYNLPNMSRVLPAQARYVSFNKEGRFTPVRKFKGGSGIIVLTDKTPDVPVEMFETVRQSQDINAPLPTPFIVEDEVNFDNL
ncbi:hypothetical protein TBLA_0F01930 [Henningerozyma blattae CBS 6284]|uniref:26S proteasome regulatory subunit RPN2 n=1 Tax=Henningerozyma blattae (strain ATCC 34711 / CBS 6284 / DSM 70876 / NBRC 10599 / NRRL Y-10934 / UCD 77-7) TaxID=1071380 RepID=I2H5T3_HENB6|nr:hypothetical protein TBLA_0F01930 [Tetrapisispora blattae CBS 6284]CCH61735.1 hypothetical protein TBLA_0F01930 [Tetrapisispora blattae CBS 6284]